MPLELSPHIKKALETMGCSNIASAEDAEKMLRAFLNDAEKFVGAQMDLGRSSLFVVRKASDDLPRIVNRIRRATVAGDPRRGVETTALCRLLAIVATSATWALKDMSFLGNKSTEGRCEGCELTGECDADGSVTDGG